MTLPNGIDGISEAIGTLFGSTGPLTSVPNAETWGANPISGMNTLTQEAVTANLKQNQILSSPGWNATTAALYDGLRRGNPTDGSVPLITSTLEAMVNKLFGTDIQWPTNSDVLDSIEQVPLMSELIGALQSIYMGLTGQESATDVLADLNTDIQTALSAIQSSTNTLLTQVLDDLGLPTTEASAFAAWLSGSAAGQRITNVSSAVIVNGNQELLDSPNFSGAISIAGNGIWTWNSSIYYIIPGETVDEPGSAQVTANGTQQILTSTPAEDIPLGQPVDYSIRVCTSGLTGSGTLLQLVAIPWIGTTAQTPIVLASSAAPTGATTGWTNPPSGSMATVLSGVYTPLVGSGITAVSMQLVLTNAALSGTVYWSAASEELTGGLINDLVNENAAGQAATATYYTSLSTAVTQILGGNWSGGFTTAENAWQAYQAAEAGVASASYVTLHQLLSMVGINTSNGMMTAGNVTSSKGLSSLQADVAALLDTSTWSTWLTNEWNTMLGWFGSPTPGTTSQTAMWTNVVNSIVNPLNAIEAQVNNVIIDSSNTLTNVFNNIFGIGAHPATAQVAAAAVQGNQGITDIGTTVQNTWDAAIASVAHYLGITINASGNPLSTVQDVLGQHASQTAQALSQAGTNANAIANMLPVVPQPLLAGALPTMVAAVTPVSGIEQNSQALTSGSPQWMSFTTLTQTTKIDSFTIIAGLSNSAGVPAGFYVNLYTVNPSTGAMTQVFASSSLVSSLAASSGSLDTYTLSYLTVALPSELSLAAGTTICADFVVAPTSTYGVKTGMVYNYAPPFPAANGYPTCVGATRSNASTLQPATIAWSVVTPNYAAPWIQFNGPGDVYNPPVIRKITANGSVVAPAWARFADVVPLGGGSSGGGGIGFPGNNGGTTTVTQGSNSISAGGGFAGPNATTSSAGVAQGTGAPTEMYTPPGATSSDSFPGSYTVAAQQPGSFPGGGGGGGNNGFGAYGFGGSSGNWNAATWPISGGETFNVTIGAGGAPTAGQGVGAQSGAAGLAYIVFRAS